MYNKYEAAKSENIDLFCYIYFLGAVDKFIYFKAYL